MTSLFKKLNYKNQPVIISLNTPDTFQTELDKMSEYAAIIKNEKNITEIDFILVFVTKQAEIDDFVHKLFSKLKGDAILWFCYPKGTSKKFKCDINRDKGWSSVKKYNLETVRQVAIDEDWSALRFRKTEYIKSMTRK